MTTLVYWLERNAAVTLLMIGFVLVWVVWYSWLIHHVTSVLLDDLASITGPVATVYTALIGGPSLVATILGAAYGKWNDRLKRETTK